MKFFVKTCLQIWPTPLLDSAEPAYAPCSLTCTIMQALNFLGQTFLCCFVLFTTFSEPVVGYDLTWLPTN